MRAPLLGVLLVFASCNTPSMSEPDGSVIDAGRVVVVDAGHDAGVEEPFDAGPIIHGCYGGCMPVAPGGWTGPMALFAGSPADEPSECPSGYSNPERSVAEVTAEPAVCSCEGLTTDGGVCSTSLAFFSDSQCNQSLGSVQARSDDATACVSTPIGAVASQVSRATVTVEPGCGVSTVRITRSTPTIGRVDLACTSSDLMPCTDLSSDRCVAPGGVAAPFARYCIQRAGENECPDTVYSVRRVSYRTVSDERACSSCVTGSSCGDAIIGSSNASCGGSASDVTVGDCVARANGSSTSVSGTAPSCVVIDGGRAVGGVTLTLPVTYCCLN